MSSILTRFSNALVNFRISVINHTLLSLFPLFFFSVSFLKKDIDAVRRTTDKGTIGIRINQCGRYVTLAV